VSVEPALHGARATSAKDARNTLRDVDGPDGLMEHDNTDVGRAARRIRRVEPNKKAWPGLRARRRTQLWRKHSPPSACSIEANGQRCVAAIPHW